jgi:hypothetical protein
VHDGNGHLVHGAIPYPVGSLTGGVIADCDVPLATAEFQMGSYSGYEIADADVHDLAAPHQRFGSTLPKSAKA